MASITELLKALNTKEAAVSTADLAKELQSSKEGTLKQLTREKEKKNVEGNSQEGWFITEKGKAELEKGEIRPSMIDEGVTPRQQFEAKARLIGIPEDRIALATDIVWSGDYTDVKWVWEALGQADIADDLRKVWVNAWRAKLQKGIPSELEVELTGVPSPAAEGEAAEGIRPKVPARDYIIVDDEPVRVGPNLGDYSLQDAKDILGLRVLRSRFAGAGQPGATSQSGTAEKVADILTALSPYLNKESKSDVETLKEVIADKLALQRQEILSHIPQPGQPAQPKSFIEQVTEFVATLGSLKEAGPTLRSILGIPAESSGNPASTAFPVQLTGPDGQPIVMDLGQVINWRKFQSEERRADERQQMLMGLGKEAKENIGPGIQAILEATQEAREERKGSAGSKSKPPAASQQFKCGDCGTQFSAPPEWAGQNIKCPNPECGREYTKEELLA